jgi:CDP-glucose 4,6-dehydratase
MDQDPVKFADAYNFGPEDEDRLTVEELIQESINIWGSGNYKVSNNPNKPHEAHLLRLSIAKAKKELNWSPKFRSKEAIAFTIDWYKRVSNGEAASEVTVNQIRNYFDISA